MPEKETVLPPAAHEPHDVGSRFILGAVLVVGGSLLLLIGFVTVLFPGALHDKPLRLPLPNYPAPELQPSPPQDFQAFYKQEMERLNSAGWINREKGIVHIPIDLAMRKVAQEGIKDWPGSDRK